MSIVSTKPNFSVEEISEIVPVTWKGFSLFGPNLQISFVDGTRRQQNGKLMEIL